MKSQAWVVLGLALGAVGCVKGSTTAGRALVHPTFPYAVTYDDDKTRSVLGEDWRLETYRRRERSSDIARKEGYELKYEFDFNDDDRTDATAALPFPDLLFLHRRTNARLQVSTLVLDSRLANKELRVLLQDIVDGRSGTRSLLVGFGKMALGVEKRFATRLIDSSEASLSEQKGIVATLERADLDQLQADPKTRWERSRLFMMHAPFQYFASGRASSGSTAPGPVGELHPYRVLLLVEYTNTAEDFEAQYAELLRLLNKTHTLTDNMLMGYLAEPLAKCAGQATKAELVLSISGAGSASIKSAGSLNPTCAGDVLKPYRFAGTGETRQLGVQLDFTLPLTPAWLTQGSYREERAAPPSAAPPAAEPTPPQPASAEPAPTTPAPAPPPEPAPAAPAAP